MDMVYRCSSCGRGRGRGRVVDDAIGAYFSGGVKIDAHDARDLLLKEVVIARN
jgi:hypothetical protein